MERNIIRRPSEAHFAPSRDARRAFEGEFWPLSEDVPMLPGKDFLHYCHSDIYDLSYI